MKNLKNLNINYEVLPVSVGDAAALLDIYTYYVRETTITFDLNVPTIAEFAERITKLSRDFPFLKLLADGKIVGFAYAHVFYEKEAYIHTAESTIYIDRDYHGKGAGRVLYGALLEQLRDEKGIEQVIAVITAENAQSAAFHKAMGFEERGRLLGVGRKFGRNLDTLYMQKQLA